MSNLAARKCEACNADSPSVAPEQQKALLASLPGWRIQTRDGVPQLSKEFKLPDFVSAMALAGRVGELAEAENHHPKLVVEWGSLSVSWWTHSIGGLHMNDFILAARTEAAAAEAA